MAICVRPTSSENENFLDYFGADFALTVSTNPAHLCILPFVPLQTEVPMALWSIVEIDNGEDVHFVGYYYKWFEMENHS